MARFHGNEAIGGVSALEAAFSFSEVALQKRGRSKIRREKEPERNVGVSESAGGRANERASERADARSN